MDCTFTKAERLNSKLTIDKLFAGGNASTVAFPLRIVYMKDHCEGATTDKTDSITDSTASITNYTESATHKSTASPLPPPVSVLISVPKKRFRHATDRNRMKRLVREAYRTNKHILWDALKDKDYKLKVAFVCITDQLPTFRTVNKSMVKALTQISERLNR